MNISTSTVTHARRKPTQNVVDDEDASELRLGPEFELTQITHDNVETPLVTLNLSETRLLINAALKERIRAEKGLAQDQEDVAMEGDDGEDVFYESNEYVFSS